MEMLGWSKSLFSFFCKIKDIFFIFMNNFIDLAISSMSAISYIVWYSIDCSQLMS